MSGDIHNHPVNKFGGIDCSWCGKVVPTVRHCYFTPVCYDCMPPPPKLEIIELPSPTNREAEG